MMKRIGLWMSLALMLSMWAAPASAQQKFIMGYGAGT
jgi:hypothetical protein